MVLCSSDTIQQEQTVKLMNTSWKQRCNSRLAAIAGVDAVPLAQTCISCHHNKAVTSGRGHLQWQYPRRTVIENGDILQFFKLFFSFFNSIHAPVGCTFISSSKHLLIGNSCIYIITHDVFWWLSGASALDIPFYSLFLSISFLFQVSLGPPLSSPASQGENNPRIHTTRHRQPPCTCRRCRHRGSSAVLQGPSTGHRPREICNQV